MNVADLDVRVKDEGRPPLGPLVHPHEITAGGLVMQDERVKVTAALVEHPLVVPALAFRFDGPDRSIVFSGDTTRSDALIALARGADVLVHEAMWLPGIDRIVQREPNATTLRKHLLESHTVAEDCGWVAEAAGVARRSRRRTSCRATAAFPTTSGATPRSSTSGVRRSSGTT